MLRLSLETVSLASTRLTCSSWTSGWRCTACAARRRAAAALQAGGVQDYENALEEAYKSVRTKLKHTPTVDDCEWREGGWVIGQVQMIRCCPHISLLQPSG